ncbi:MAG: septum formation protein Maf [Planctomycetales bacterium]|nr:septum formation protein Maf [Planctomycetales bacterium]
MRIVLASQSPRRRELLTAAGYEFDVVVPSDGAECGICSRESTPELVARMALQKAQDVRSRIEGSAIVVACDTLADIMGRVLGKPENRQHAEEMLRLLSGRQHSVYSGLCILQLPGGRPMLEVAKSVLVMENLTEEQIESYLDSEQWVGKSGAFGYQDGHPWLRLISGTSENVVGLPMDLLQRMLKSLKN